LNCNHFTQTVLCSCTLLRRAAMLCASPGCSPSDAAVKSFLGEMGLSLAELKARPGLARRIVASHLLLGSNVRAQVGTRGRLSSEARDEVQGIGQSPVGGWL
jgi:hypothetical protein